jgi:hypothetical protein
LPRGSGYSIESLLIDQDGAVEDARAVGRRSQPRGERARAAAQAEQWRTRGSESLAWELQDKARSGDPHAAKIRELIMAVNGER